MVIDIYHIIVSFIIVNINLYLQHLDYISNSCYTFISLRKADPEIM